MSATNNATSKGKAGSGSRLAPSSPGPVVPRLLVVLVAIVVLALGTAPAHGSVNWPRYPACHNDIQRVQFTKLHNAAGRAPHIEKWNVAHTHYLARIWVNWAFCFNAFMGPGRLAWYHLVPIPDVPWWSVWRYDGVITKKTVWGCIHTCASVDRYLQFEFDNQAGQHWYPCMRFKMYGSGWLDIAGAGGGPACADLASGGKQR